MSESVKQEATLCKGGQEWRKKIVPKRAIPLGLGSKLPVEDTGVFDKDRGRGESADHAESLRIRGQTPSDEIGIWLTTQE